YVGTSLEVLGHFVVDRIVTILTIGSTSSLCVCRQISIDCDFLKNQGIIDYSLLLGLHFRAPEHLKAPLEPPNSLHEFESSVSADGPISEGECSIPPRGLLLVTHEPSSVNTAPGTHIRGNTLRAYSVGDKEVDLLLPGTGR
ncbi:hypothetical protein Leryth_007321, partial [Lithospermum erythrorhizon]